MTEQQLRDEMVQIGASLFSRGYATGSAGNLSLLLPDGNLLATPTGSCLGLPAGARSAQLYSSLYPLCGDACRRRPGGSLLPAGR